MSAAKRCNEAPAHSFTPAHNEAATPAFGFPAPPLPQGRDGNWGLCSLSSEGPVTVELGSMNPHQRDRGRSCSQDSLPPLTITPQKRAHPWDTGWPPGLDGAGSRLGSQGHGQQNCVWLVGHGGYVNMVSPLIISHVSVPSC